MSVDKAATRVCIKNVPHKFDETKLQSFLQQGSQIPLTVTDCKILRSTNHSRQLAFVGFKTREMAQHVVDRFHCTYAQTSKLSVELAYSKSADKPRPWSKHSKGSSRYQKLHQEEERKRDEEKQKKVNTKMSEKFQVTKRQEVWSDFESAETEEGENEQGRNDDVGSENSSSQNYDIDTDSDDSGGEGANVMTSFHSATGVHGSVAHFLQSKRVETEDLRAAHSEDDDSSTTSYTSSSSHDSTFPNITTWPHPRKRDDLSIARNHDMGSLATEGKSTTPIVKSPSAVKLPQDSETQQQRHDNPLNDSLSSNRLFCRNLPFSCTEEELRDLFKPFGKVLECHIAVDDSRRPKGYGFVTLATASVCLEAREALDGTDFQGRLLHLLPAKQRPQSSREKLDGTYKQRQEAQRKQDALQSKVGANASFVSGDAALDRTSQLLGITKGHLLNVKQGLSSGDAAVRLALAETQIIEENRDYFKENGIDMDSLVSVNNETENVKRSTTRILVKNLPFDTSSEELNKMFCSSGQNPLRMLLPPSKTIALVEYEHAVDARRAFQKMAYKRYKHVPLYLEWAPLASITEKMQEPSADSEPNQLEHDDDKNASVSHTIYVKNLNFSTTEYDLEQFFSKQIKSMRSVRIPTKNAPLKRRTVGGQVDEVVKPHSLGYGFVECDSAESVRKAIQKLNGKLLDGHALELRRSTMKVDGKRTPATQKKKSTKLVVRNVPFQATRSELLKLFGSFGQLQRVRLPKKFDGSHRGFAFVEFTSGEEAQNALNALSRTHLYGRHLVLEWAQETEDMLDLRDKAQRDVFKIDSNPRTRKKHRSD